MGLARGALLPLVMLCLIACDGGVSEPVPSAVVSDPQSEPRPLDGLLEFGLGEHLTLTVHAFYDANSNDQREAEEIRLGTAGLRLIPVKEGENGPEKTGPGRIVRTDKNGVLIARVPAGRYSLEFVSILSPGSDPNAALWASGERVLNLTQDMTVDLPAFCQVEAQIQPNPTGLCEPIYDLRPRAYLAAVPEEIKAGGTAKLRYRADDEAQVTLEPFGEVESFRATGFYERDLQPAATTVYTLIAKNAYASREIKATVTVQ